MINFESFSDELEKISSLGSMASSAGKWMQGQYRGVLNNAAKTIGGFKNPIQSIKRGWNHPTHKWDPKNWKTYGGVPMTVATTALDAHSAVKKEDPTGQGRSRLERVGTAIGNFGGGMIGQPHGVTGSLLGSAIGRGVGKRVGQAANFTTNQLRRQPQQG